MGRYGGIQLYVERILALERTIDRGAKALSSLYYKLEQGSQNPDPNVVKSQLDVIERMVHTAKVQADFYIKLGQSYDMVVFFHNFLSELERRDPVLAIQVVAEVEKEWFKGINQ